MKMSAQERFNKACEETNALRKNIYKLNDTIFGKEIVSGTLIDAIMMLPKNEKEKLINDIFNFSIYFAIVRRQTAISTHIFCANTII